MSEDSRKRLAAFRNGDLRMLQQMKTGLVSITFRKLSVEEIVGLVQRTKLEGIEWGGDVHVPHGDLVRAETVRRVTVDAGLGISAYGSYYRFDECLGQRVEDEVAWSAVLDTASALEAPTIRVWAGRLGAEATSDELRGRIVERCREICEEAQARNISIGLEFHDQTLTDSNEGTAAFLQEVGHANLFTFWQPYMCATHAYRMEGLRALLGSVSNIHCNHFSKEGWPHSLMLEEGEEAWSDILGVLASDERERWISIEHVKDHEVENFLRDAATLRRWVLGRVE